MKLLVKVIVIAALAAVAFVAYSYVGSRAAVGKLLGSDPPLSGRVVVFEWDGVYVAGRSGRQKAWVFTFTRSTLPGVRSARIIVSPTGEILATEPPNLDEILDAWDRNRLP